MKKTKSFLCIFFVFIMHNNQTSQLSENSLFLSSTHPGHYLTNKEQIKKIIQLAITIPKSKIYRAITINTEHINQSLSRMWLFNNPTKWAFVYAIFFSKDSIPFSTFSENCYITPQITYQDTLAITDDIHIQNILREDTLRGIERKNPKQIKDVIVVQKLMYQTK